MHGFISLREPLTATHYMVALAGKMCRLPVRYFWHSGASRQCCQGYGNEEQLYYSRTTGSMLWVHPLSMHCRPGAGRVRSRLQLIARSAGQPIVIEDAEMNRIIEKFKATVSKHKDMTH